MRIIGQKILFILVVALFFWPLPSSGLGLLVKPQKLEVISSPANFNATEIMVLNNSDQPAIYLVSSDGWQNQISIEPNEFKLEPNESKAVKIYSRFLWPGSYKTNIAVIAKSLSAGDALAVPGVKIPYKINISNWFYVLFLGLIIFFCFVLFFAVKWLLSIKRNKNEL